MFDRIAKLRFVVLADVVLALAPNAVGQTTWYVDDDAPLGGDGTIWDTAFRYLQDALALADDDDEVRVAGGTYKPDQDEAGNVIPSDRDASFHLISSGMLCGGYAGLADPNNPDVRDIDLYESVLSGDLAGDDGPGFENNGENSRRVVRSLGADSSAILDGFTITAGNGGTGAGLYNLDGSPTISRCTFLANMASYGGGGLSTEQGFPTLADCVFMGNTCVGITGGGAVRSRYRDWLNDGGLTLVRCELLQNSATNGGGAIESCQTRVTMIDCVLENNIASWGGGLCSYGYPGYEGDAVINCTFANNEASWGGGVYQHEESLEMHGCTFTANIAYWHGGAICAAECYYEPNYPAITDCAFFDNVALGDEPNYFQPPGGGAIYNSASYPHFQRCVFHNNHATSDGGAILSSFYWYWYEYEPVLTLDRCVVSHNSAGQHGGALAHLNYFDVHCHHGGRCVLTNTVFDGNVAGSRGGAIYDSEIWAWGGESLRWLGDCTFVDNRAEEEAGGDAIYSALWVELLLNNCILRGSSGQIVNTDDTAVMPTYCDIEGDWPGEGNIDADPLFVDPDGPDNDPNTWEDNDYHLLGDSPCIDAGDNDAVPEWVTTDLDGRLRFADRIGTPDSGNGTAPIVDMGAYEYQCGGDLDGDGEIGLADLATLLPSYGTNTDATYADGDIDQDGDVDLSDLAALLSVYGTTCQ